ENAAAAALVALRLGVNAEAIQALLPRFPGVARRFEVLGVTSDGIRVVDDYAHNGEKIRAALTTAQAGAPRVVAARQPAPVPAARASGAAAAAPPSPGPLLLRGDLLCGRHGRPRPLEPRARRRSSGAARLRVCTGPCGRC